MFLQMNFYSKELGKATTVNVLIPEKCRSANRPYKTMWLLHGLTDDHTAWMRYTAIERYANEWGIAVVMPNADRSWYTNTAYDFQHWLNIGKAGAAKGNLPKIFCVNWFRKTADGKFMWPGFGDNSRPLAWVFGRCAGTADGVDTAIGILPTTDSIDRQGIEDEVTDADIAELLKVDTEGWRKELEMIEEHYAKFGAKLPAALKDQLAALKARLG